MAVTNFAALTQEQKTLWSMDLWRQARHASFIDKLVGNDQNSIIQRIDELKKDEKGARAVITLLADLRGDGIADGRLLPLAESHHKTFDAIACAAATEVLPICSLRTRCHGVGASILPESCEMLCRTFWRVTHFPLGSCHE